MDNGTGIVNPSMHYWVLIFLRYKFACFVCIKQSKLFVS